jgi:hypothetical protein
MMFDVLGDFLVFFFFFRCRLSVPFASVILFFDYFGTNEITTSTSLVIIDHVYSIDTIVSFTI